MSATICYRIVKPAKSLGVDLPSGFQETCSRVFGSLPRNFGDGDIPQIQTLMAAFPNESGWLEMLGIIEKYGEIEVFAEY